MSVPVPSEQVYDVAIKAFAGVKDFSGAISDETAVMVAIDNARDPLFAQWAEALVEDEVVRAVADGLDFSYERHQETLEQVARQLLDIARRTVEGGDS